LIKLPLPHDYCVHLVPCVFEWLICFEVCCSYAIRQHVATTSKSCLLKNVFVFLAQTKPYQSQRPHTKKATFPEYHEVIFCQPEDTKRRNIKNQSPSIPKLRWARKLVSTSWIKILKHKSSRSWSHLGFILVVSFTSL
jgi:hypothetical protein